jgi:hypothetical protein
MSEMRISQMTEFTKRLIEFARNLWGAISLRTLDTMDRNSTEADDYFKEMADWSLRRDTFSWH